MKIEDMFWGVCVGLERDLFGHLWSVVTNKEELTPEEMQQKQVEWLRSMKK
jgi:hypothetical protein